MRSDITPGQTSDDLGFELVRGGNRPKPSVFTADRDHDSDSVRKTVQARRVVPVIPMRKPRKLRFAVDRTPSRLRNIVALRSPARTAGSSSAALGTAPRLSVSTTFRIHDNDNPVIETYETCVPRRGMQVQAVEVERLNNAGLTAGTIMPAWQSVEIMGTLDEVRRQIGPFYPGNKKDTGVEPKGPSRPRGLTLREPDSTCDPSGPPS